MTKGWEPDEDDGARPRRSRMDAVVPMHDGPHGPGVNIPPSLSSGIQGEVGRTTVVMKPGWTDDQVRKFVKDLKSAIGPDGWRFMTPEVRRAFVDSACLSIVLAQDGENVNVGKATMLRARMHTVAGTA